VSDLPDFSKAWDYENGFYLTSEPIRLGKLFAHYELFKSITDLPGAIVECGVFKGASLARFAAMRELFGSPQARRIVAFDTFGEFPQTEYGPDESVRQHFVDQAGDMSVGVADLEEVLTRKGAGANVELVAGDIVETVPEYAARHPELKIALLNLDTDIYEPAVAILEHLYPRIVPGGVLLLDDYGTFPGETQAVDEYFAGQDVTIQKLPFAMTPCFVRKRP
jgi:hypothetical protein